MSILLPAAEGKPLPRTEATKATKSSATLTREAAKKTTTTKTINLKEKTPAGKPALPVAPVRKKKEGLVAVLKTSESEDEASSGSSCFYSGEESGNTSQESGMHWHLTLRLLKYLERKKFKK